MILNNNIITKTTSDNKYGLGINGKPYILKVGGYKVNGELRLAKKWVQVHYASYERMEAMRLLKEVNK